MAILKLTYRDGVEVKHTITNIDKVALYNCGVTFTDSEGLMHFVPIGQLSKYTIDIDQPKKEGNGVI